MKRPVVALVSLVVVVGLLVGGGVAVVEGVPSRYRDVTLAVTLTTAPLLLLAVLDKLSRLRAAGALVLAVVGVVGAVALGLASVTELPALPGLLGLQDATPGLLAWALFGGLAAAAGGLRVPGPPVVGAALSGALLGELGAAAALAGTARDDRGAARLVLAATGGALLGRIGDPAILAAGTRLPETVGAAHLPLPLALVPLALAMIAVAAPTRAHVDEAGGSPVVTAVAAVVGVVGLLLPQLAPAALGVGAVIMAGLALQRHGPALLRGGEVLGTALGPFLWTLGSVVLALAATAGGLPELSALGLEEVQEQLRGVLLPLFAAGGALLSALVGGEAAGLLAAALIDRGLSLRVEELPVAVVVGVAAGGLGPLAVAGALKAGLLRWLVQVVLAVGWVALLLQL